MLIPFTIHKHLKEHTAGITLDDTAMMMRDVVEREPHGMDYYMELVSAIKTHRGMYPNAFFRLDGKGELSLFTPDDRDPLRCWTVTSGKEPPPKPPLPHEYPALILAELQAMNSRLANVEQTLHNIETNTYSG